MEEIYLREKANCLRNEMNHLWTGMFLTGGGAVGFSIMQEKSFLILTLMLIGFFLTLVFLNAYMVRRLELKEILNILYKERESNGKYSEYNV